MYVGVAVKKLQPIEAPCCAVVRGRQVEKMRRQKSSGEDHEARENGELLRRLIGMRIQYIERRRRNVEEVAVCLRNEHGVRRVQR